MIRDRLNASWRVEQEEDFLRQSERAALGWSWLLGLDEVRCWEERRAVRRGLVIKVVCTGGDWDIIYLISIIDTAYVQRSTKSHVDKKRMRTVKTISGRRVTHHNCDSDSESMQNSF